MSALAGGAAAVTRSPRKVRGRVAGVRVRGGELPRSRSASVLLASEGRDFTAASLELAARLAADADRTVQVLSIARVHGVSFGLQHSGLMPTRAEWQEQHDIVKRAVKALRKRGLDAEGQVLGTRKPAQRICALASELGADGIVMGADRSRSRLIGGMMWSQEPQHVQRRSKVPVHLSVDATADA
jgi:nucleotide-binding universal stress UspA family protein